MTLELEQACTAVHDAEIARYAAVRAAWLPAFTAAQAMHARYRHGKICRPESHWEFNIDGIVLCDQNFSTVVSRLKDGKFQTESWVRFLSEEELKTTHATIEDALIHIYREDIQRVARESLDNPSY